jgi:hypothetical protein
MATYEELDSVWSEVEEQLAQRGCLVFPADIDPGEGPRAYWPDGPISEFLDLAEQLGAAPIFASAARFEPDDLEDLDRFLAQSSSKTAKSLLHQAQQHTGDVYEVQVAFVNGGAFLVWTAIAEWYEEMQARADEEADSADVVRSAEQSLQEDAWVQALARSAKFERAKTLEQRLRVAEQTFPELEQMRSSSDPWFRAAPRRIVRAAWDLYLEEIQPEQERRIAQQAKALLESGARKYEVAGQLGVSENRLNRILAQYTGMPQPR